MKIVIEVEDSLTDAMMRRQLADVQRLIEEGETDGWAGLETAFKYFQVTRIVGVIGRPESTGHIIMPLEGSKAVEL